MDLLPEFAIVPFTDPRAVLPWVNTDMLVLTKAKTNSARLGPGPQAMDDALGGAISERMRQENFGGEFGTQLVFEFPGRPQRFILLVGLGAPSLLNQIVLAEVFRGVLDKVSQLQVLRLTMPVVGLRKRLPGCPLRLTDVVQVIAGETMRQRMVIQAEYPRVLEFYCRGQATRHAQRALALAHEQMQQGLPRAA